MPELILTLVLIVAIIVVLALFFSFVPIGLWISATASDVKIGLFQLVAMRIRKVVPSRIVNPMIKATKAGLTISHNKLEAHYLAGGNVDRVVQAFPWILNGPAPSTWPAGTCSTPFR